jgi:hypothetical protein
VRGLTRSAACRSKDGLAQPWDSHYTGHCSYQQYRQNTDDYALNSFSSHFISSP